MELYEKDVCIYCGKSLSKWERPRSYCWNCGELTSFEPFQEVEVEGEVEGEGEVITDDSYIYFSSSLNG